MRHTNVHVAFAVVMSLLMWVPAVPECDAQVFLFEWGQAGTGDGQFNSPSGIAVDSQGNLYVADTGNHRIQKFDDQGTFLLKWGSPGSGVGQFNSPKGVAVDSADNVYVVDSGNHRIQKFSVSGGFVTAWGSLGSGPGQFNQPFGVAVDSQNNIYVTDTGNDRVQKFGGNGAYIASWGVTGDGVGQFRSPQAVAAWMPADGADLIYVGEANSRIQAFDSVGADVLEFGSEGEWIGGFNGVGGIGVVEYELFVSDAGNHRMQKFGYEGSPILKWGLFGRDDGRFNRPAGVAGSGSVTFVVDAGNNRVQAFGPALPAIQTLDRNLSFTLSWTNTRAVGNAGLSCQLPADTIQNVYWMSPGMAFLGRQYSEYVSGVSLVLTTTYAANGRIVSEELDLAMESSARAVGTVTVVEVDPVGNYCESEGDVVLAGTPAATVVTPGQQVTPVQGGGMLSGGFDNIGGGGGCFIGSLTR